MPHPRADPDASTGWAIRPGGLSAVEHEPADVVPQPLVVEDELANRRREMIALPTTFTAGRVIALSLRCGGPCGLDRVRGRAEIVRSDMCDVGGLGSGISGMSGCPAQISGCGVCMAGGRAGLRHRDLTAHPGASLRYRVTRSHIRWLGGLEEVEDVLSTHRRPQREEPMIRVGEGSTPTDRDQTRVADFWKDHDCTDLITSPNILAPGKGAGSTHNPIGRNATPTESGVAGSA